MPRNMYEYLCTNFEQKECPANFNPPPSGKKDRGRGTQAAGAATLGTRSQASPPPSLPVAVDTPSAVTTGMGLSGGQFLEGHTKANPLGGHSAPEGQNRLLTGKKWAERPKTGGKGG